MNIRQARKQLLLGCIVYLFASSCQWKIRHHLAVGASTESAKVDVYVGQKLHDGKGHDQSSDAFAPQETVTLFAEVLYNGSPVTDRLVAFEVSGPINEIHNITLLRIKATNASGIATLSFRLPWPEEDAEVVTFGVWTVYAVVSVAGEKVQDTLTFRTGWIVDIDSVVTVGADSQPQTEFSKETELGVDLLLMNIAMSPQVATVAIVLCDRLDQQVSSVAFEDVELQPGLTKMHSVLSIPAWVELGQAKVGVGAFTASLDKGGIAYCPWASTTLWITWRNIAVVAVSTSTSIANRGDIVDITVCLINEGLEAENFTLSVYYDQVLIEKLQAVEVAPNDEREYIFAWDTSTLLVGDYTISAEVNGIPGEIETSDNRLVNGIVTVGAPLSPEPFSAFPAMLILVLLLAVGAAVCIIASAHFYENGRIETRSRWNLGGDSNSSSSTLTTARPGELAPRRQENSITLKASSKVAPKKKGAAKSFLIAVVDLTRLRRKQLHF